MNIEQHNLMYFVADRATFAEYGVHEQGTELQSGKIFIHAGLCGTMAVRYNGDDRVRGYTHEGLMAYLEYVDGYKGVDDVC